MTQAQVISIGDELLKGSTLNSNAAFLGSKLTPLGIDVTGIVICRDRITEIAARLGEAIASSEIIILTGGLGPTPDDVTRDAVATYFNSPLVFSKQQYDRILRFYRVRRKEVPEIVRREAEFPKIATPLINRHGIALGFYVELVNKLIVSLPGVPSEMEKMTQELVLPLVKRKLRLSGSQSLVVRLCGISEPTVIEKLGKEFFNHNMQFGIYPALGDIVIRIQCHSLKLKRTLQNAITRKLKAFIYSYDDRDLASVVGDVLRRKKETLSVVESCSGGILSAKVTAISGASSFYKGGVIAYSNFLKSELLNIPPKLLVKKGAVSSEVARSLACGMRELTQSDYALSITGIAGPTGATKAKPIGTVYIGFAQKKVVKTYRYRFVGSRRQIQEKSALKALELLWRVLEK